jgi:hypothetical protein
MPTADLFDFIIDIHRGVLLPPPAFLFAVDGAIEAVLL